MTGVHSSDGDASRPLPATPSCLGDHPNVSVDSTVCLFVLGGDYEFLLLLVPDK